MRIACVVLLLGMVACAGPTPGGKTAPRTVRVAQSGGALLDLHIHDSDFVQYCFGRPRRVHSSGLSHLSGAIDHVMTRYIVAGGADIYAEGTWLMTPLALKAMSA